MSFVAAFNGCKLLALFAIRYAFPQSSCPHGIISMAKKNTQNRKSNGAAAIKTIEEDVDQNDMDTQPELNGSDTDTPGPSKRTPKAKVEQPSEGNFGVSEIKKAAAKKAAAFVNSVGGLDKAMTLLQILKVAKDVQ